MSMSKTLNYWLLCYVMMLDKSFVWLFTASRRVILLAQFGLLNFALYWAMLYAFINLIPSDIFLGVQFLKSCIFFFGITFSALSVMAFLFLFLGLFLPDSKKKEAVRRSILIDKARNQPINGIRKKDA